MSGGNPPICANVFSNHLLLLLYLVTSWFAGHMDETEAANLLGDQSPGHFLIRISSSRAHEGVFVLAVKTRDDGVVQIQIEVSRIRTFCHPFQRKCILYKWFIALESRFLFKSYNKFKL